MARQLSSAQAQLVVDLGNATRTKYPRAFSKCHVEGDPEKHDFIILFAQEALRLNITLPSHKPGMNGKRGTNEPSMDVLSFMDTDTGIITDVRVVDVVVGAGSSSASIGFNDVTEFGPGKWLDPTRYQTRFDYGTTPGDCQAQLNAALAKIKQLEEQLKNSVAKVNYPGDFIWDTFGKIIESDYGRAGRKILGVDGNTYILLDAQSFRWAGRTIHDDYMEGLTLEESIAEHRKEWCDILGIPVV